MELGKIINNLEKTLEDLKEYNEREPKEYDGEANKTIKFKNLQWWELKDGRLLLKDILDEEHIKRYVDDEFMRTGSWVRHQDHIREYKWEKSYIKNTVLERFKEELGNEVITVDLLSEEEFNELDENMKNCNEVYWLKSPRRGNNYFVRDVDSSGYVDYNYARNAGGVRPVITLKKESLEQLNIKN